MLLMLVIRLQAKKASSTTPHDIERRKAMAGKGKATAKGGKNTAPKGGKVPIFGPKSGPKTGSSKP